MTRPDDAPAPDPCEFAYLIEVDQGGPIGASANPVVAFAMYRAACDAFFDRGVVLKRSGQVLATGD